MFSLRTVILAVLLVMTLRASYSLIARAPTPTAVASPAPSRQPSGAAVRAGASGSRDDEEAAADRTATASPVKGRWKDFGVAFPCAPNVTELPADAFRTGGQRFIAKNDGRAYMVTRMDSHQDVSQSPAKANAIVASLVAGFTKDHRVERSAALASEQGYAVWELVVTNAQGTHLRAHIYLAGGLVFFVVVTAAERSALFDEAAEQFFASFEII